MCLADIYNPMYARPRLVTRSGCVCVPVFTTVLKIQDTSACMFRAALISISPRYVTDDTGGGEADAAAATLMNTLLLAGLATSLIFRFVMWSFSFEVAFSGGR